MQAHQTNPWANRFEPLLNRNVIKEKSAVRVQSLEGLGEMSTGLACRLVERALETVFYPTTQCIDIMHRFVDLAFAHCIITYPDNKSFIQGVYLKRPPLPKFVPPILLTGLAGIGKSELIKAFHRIQVEEQTVSVDIDHSSFLLRRPWQISVDVRTTTKAILSSLSKSSGDVKEQLEQCRKIAFRDGIPFLQADEFQFATSSEKANTLVTQMLLSLGHIGIPWVYNANYSLVNRILKRPEEDRQRLLADTIVLLPDAPESEDWINTLRAQQSVAMDYFQFDPEKDAAELHRLSGGRKRAVKDLLLLALKNEHPNGKTVDLAAIINAYKSPPFANYREDAEILLTQSIQDKAQSERPELWCPIPLPKNATAVFKKHATELREERLADAELESSLNKEEREALHEFKKASKKFPPTTGKVIPIRKNQPPTAEELKQNNNWFIDQI